MAYASRRSPSLQRVLYVIALFFLRCVSMCECDERLIAWHTFYGAKNHHLAYHLCLTYSTERTLILASLNTVLNGALFFERRRITDKSIVCFVCWGSNFRTHFIIVLCSSEQQIVNAPEIRLHKMKLKEKSRKSFSSIRRISSFGLGHQCSLHVH